MLAAARVRGHRGGAKCGVIFGTSLQSNWHRKFRLKSIQMHRSASCTSIASQGEEEAI